MRTAIAILTLLLAATARASDWDGTWRTDKGEQRQLLASGKLLALDGAFVADDARNVHLVGLPSGHRLHLEGRLEGTAGIRGALGGERSSGRKHTVVLDGDLDERTSTADVSIKVDGEERKETWSRGGLAIVRLESDGSELAGSFEPKRSRSGLVVRYRVNGSPLRITARVVPAQRHPYASFYEGRDVMRRDLGTVPPGDHELAWDGRDETPAKRIALGGTYVVALEAGTVSAETSVEVAPPRFAAIFSDWSKYPDGHRPWNPAKHLEQVTGLLLAGTTPGGSGFVSDAPRPVTRPAEAADRAHDAASILISTHGIDGTLAVCDGTTKESFDPAQVFGHDLKDVHFAFVSACYSGTGRDGATTADKLVAAGCDVAIGFNGEVDITESEDFETVTTAILARGCPIEKAARDAGEALSTLRYERGACVPIRGREVIVVRRGAGIPETETLWPPRHGCSTN